MAGTLSGVISGVIQGFGAGSTGGGTLYATGVQQFKPSTTLTGTGALSSEITPQRSTAPGTSGAGTLTTVQSQMYIQTANLTAAGALTETHTSQYFQLASLGLASAGTLSATAVPTSVPRDAALSGDGTLSATATKKIYNPTYLGSTTTPTSGATTLTLPTHAVGDLIVIVADSRSATVPSVPAAGGTVPTWTTIGTDSTYGQIMAYAVATATNHTSGTWTSAVDIMSIVVRNQAPSNFIGGYGFGYGGTKHGSSPEVTLADPGHSLLFHFQVQRGSTNITWTAVGTGYTLLRSLGSGTTTAYRIVRKDDTTSDGYYDSGFTGTASAGWYESLEIV